MAAVNLLIEVTAAVLALMQEGPSANAPGEIASGSVEQNWTLEASLLAGLVTFKGEAAGGFGVEAGGRLAISSNAFVLLHYRYFAGKGEDDSSKPNDTFYIGTPGSGTRTSDTVEMEDVLLGIGIYALRKPTWTVDLHLAVGVRWAHVERTVEEIRNEVTVSSYEKKGSGMAVPAILESKIEYLASPNVSLGGGLWVDGSLLHGYGTNHGVEVGVGLLAGIEVRF